MKPAHEILKAAQNHNHYRRDVRHLDTIDVYRVLKLYGVTDPCVQHAVKKLLCSGRRGVKTESQDVREAIDSLNRYLQMASEDDSFAGQLNEIQQKNTHDRTPVARPVWTFD